MAAGSKGTIVAALIDWCIRYGAERGADPERLRRIAGQPEGGPVDPEARVPISVSYDVWAELMRALRDPAVPIDFANRRQMDQYGLMGFAILTSRDGRQGFLRLMRFSRLFTDSGEWTMEETTESVIVRWLRPGQRTLGHRVANEAALGGFVQGVRGVAQRSVIPRRVTFQHRAPEDTDAHDRYFGCAVEFGAGEDSIHFDPDVLDFSSRMSNDAMHAYIVQDAEKRLAELEAEAVADRVRAIVERELPSGAPSAGDVARQLAMSERTMRRALEAEQTTFREILTRVRRERARTLLTESNATVSEIAFLLGFSTVSAFTRAFRSTEGRSPGEFRTQSQRPIN